MKIRFTKMQGAGNDFVVIDATRERLVFTRQQWRWLAHRRYGVGADQILVVELPEAGEAEATEAGVSIDFIYRIFNADGGEVEQCGNGARCFVKFVRDQGLTDKHVIRVRTRSGVIEPRLQEDGRVAVDMGAPVFEIARVPFLAAGLTPQVVGAAHLWPLPVAAAGKPEEIRWIEAVSMGNPHAVQLVDSVADAPVPTEGPGIERHPRFSQRVNAGYMEIVSRSQIRLRVYERGAGETLACGTGACAAVVSGIHRGLLDNTVDVHTRGGPLTIRWDGQAPQGPDRQGGRTPAAVLMIGPAATVFCAEVDVPDNPVLPD